MTSIIASSFVYELLDRYEKLSSKALIDVINDEMGALDSDLKQALQGVLRSAQSLPDFFAENLIAAFKGGRTAAYWGRALLVTHTTGGACYLNQVWAQTTRLSFAL